MATLYDEHGTPYDVDDDLFEDEDDYLTDEERIEAIEQYLAQQGGGPATPEQVDGQFDPAYFEQAMVNELRLVQARVGRELTSREADQLIDHFFKTEESPSDSYTDVLKNTDLTDTDQRVAHAAEILEDDAAAQDEAEQDEAVVPAGPLEVEE